jgi:acyl carrier protein
MDQYARYRNRQVEQGECWGHTVSINWPLWAEGGMQLDASALSHLRQMGHAPLVTASGLLAFHQSLGLGVEQVVVLSGQASSIRENMATGNDIAHTSPVEEMPAIQAVTASELQTEALRYFKQQLAQALKLNQDRIEVDAALENYGMNSILAMELTSFLEKQFGRLSKTLFFEVQTVRALSEYFITNHTESLRKIISGKLLSTATQQPNTAKVQAPLSIQPAAPRRKHLPEIRRQINSIHDDDSIAIIGVSGRYPQAPNLDVFWDNLQQGRDCVTEIPADRWDYQKYFDPNKGVPGKSYSKWGGFIDGVDEFDPLFFNISPRDTAFIDPQERLFLQCVYNTLEDAGYTREGLAQPHGIAGNLPANVGVFVGVMYEEYQLYAAQAQALGWNLAVPTFPSSIANRVSYWCNFSGPSMAVDTMCSSSITAIHLAMQNFHPLSSSEGFYLGLFSS